MIELVYASGFVTLLAIIVLFFITSNYKGYAAGFAVFTNALLISVFAFPALSGQVVDFSVFAGNFLGDISIHIDALSAWFILIINFTSVTGVFYGIGYLKAYRNPSPKLTLHWTLFILFHLSMVLVCMLKNGFAFLLAWELMSLTSMLLVIFDHHNPQTLKAGINYLVQMHISVVFLTIGFIWVYSTSGSFGFDAIRSFFQSNNNIWLFLIFFAGFGLKAGFIPLHSWLPHAHPAAPSHVSGVMSGVIVKMGIYGIFRIITFLNADYIILGEIILSLSVLTGIYGILNASVHRDFKKMLAYCTIENIGIIGIGIGTGLIGIGNSSPAMCFLGFGGALLHVLNHSLFKSLLFFSAGSVYQQSHTRDMEQLGGLIKTMPKTAAIFLVGSIAIGGLPPFNGFVSEFVIYMGLLDGINSNNLSQLLLFVLSLAGLSVIGGLSVLTFTKTFGTIFLGQPRTILDHKPHEVSNLMLVPQYIIIALMLSVAFMPQFYLQIIGKALVVLSPMVDSQTNLSGIGGTISAISLYSLLFLSFVGVILFVRFKVLKNKAQRIDATWGCGYVAPNSRQQYTGKSFSKPLGKIINFLLIENKHYEELKPGEIFPEKRSYVSHYLDFIEHNLIEPITQRLVYSANYFSFIQNGRIQSYVLYGIVFILAMFILTLFNIVG
jgi:formate hydrogenlyase subunit 3/multisubunit Na+/H+ antiporter MnhD subunit